MLNYYYLMFGPAGSPNTIIIVRALTELHVFLHVFYITDDVIQMQLTNVREK